MGPNRLQYNNWSELSSRAAKAAVGKEGRKVGLLVVETGCSCRRRKAEAAMCPSPG